MDAVETDHLTKRYGSREVLHELALRVPRGSLYGFLGPNGAGKTTAIRIMLGLLRATHGTARILGHDCWSDGPRLRAQVGYLPGDVRFYDHLTGRRLLRYFNRARGGAGTAEIDRLAERFELELDKKIRSYSRGMKQKLGLIQALMHRPQLLMLDEPTTALDPLVRQSLHEELVEVARQGRTVLFSSHTLAEVELLCDRVAILRDGHLIEESEIGSLRGRAVRHVEVVFTNHVQAAIEPPAQLTSAHFSGERLTGTWRGPVEPLLAWLRSHPVQDITITMPSLEDLFLTYYADKPGGAPQQRGAA
jgi:ABC-2 type transport system ATP-binding protein